MWAYFFAKGHSVPVIFLYHDVEERYGIFIRFLVELIDQEIFYHVVNQGASYGNGVLAVVLSVGNQHTGMNAAGILRVPFYFIFWFYDRPRRHGPNLRDSSQTRVDVARL